MLYALAFMMTFVLGGFTGVLLAFPPLDYLAHNTLFLVAHFHNMLIPGLLYGMLAGYHYWFPKAFGFRLDEKWGRIAFGCWVVGFYLAFMPLYVLGAAGVARRTQELFEPAFRPWLYIAGLGALVLLGALASLFIQLWVSVRQRDANRVTAGDPWDGRGLERRGAARSGRRSDRGERGFRRRPARTRTQRQRLRARARRARDRRPRRGLELRIARAHADGRRQRGDSAAHAADRRDDRGCGRARGHRGSADDHAQRRRRDGRARGRAPADPHDALGTGRRDSGSAPARERDPRHLHRSRRGRVRTAR